MVIGGHILADSMTTLRRMVAGFKRKFNLTGAATVWAAWMVPVHAQEMPIPAPSYTSRAATELRGVFEASERDWRNGAVIYQVLVDRFAPSAQLEQKRVQ